MTAQSPAVPRPELIAPCGIDCRLCQRFQRSNSPCPGCRGEDRLKLSSCLNCRIKNCERIKSGELRFCDECPAFPCARITSLDKRYRAAYGTSPIGNLGDIAALGLKEFVHRQDERWRCDACAEVLCMHAPACPNCGKVWRK